jgi:hypothetical protein
MKGGFTEGAFKNQMNRGTSNRRFPPFSIQQLTVPLAERFLEDRSQRLRRSLYAPPLGISVGMNEGRLSSLRSRRYPLGWLSHRFCRSQRDQYRADHNEDSHSEQFAASDET